jgi:hypothetical protein
MAKRRKHKKSYRRSGRSRMSGIGAISSNITEIGGMLVGAIAGNYVTNVLLKDQFKDQATLKNAIPLVAGFALQSFVKQPMIKNVATGMIVVGGLNTVRGVVPAIGELMDSDIRGIEEEITVGAMDMIEEDITVGELTDSISEITGSEELD